MSSDASLVLDPLDPDRLVLERLVAEFERSWRSGRRPSIDGLLPASCGARRAVLLELVHAELEFRLKAGEPARVEDYLRRYPELGKDECAILGLVAAEFRQRRRREPDLDPEECVRRFDRIPAEALAQALRELGDGPGRTAGTQAGVGVGFEKSPGDAESGRALVPDPPRGLGRYELLEVIGEGATGIVYRGRDTALGRHVAVKIPRSDRAASLGLAERFLREARSAAGLRHPNIVPVYDAGRDGGTLYIVSAFVRGTDLAHRSAVGRLDRRTAARLVAEVAEALHYAHGQGVIHRDLKPSNILLDADGRPHVLDFGLAKSTASNADATLTLEGQVLGTPAYMAPELARGEARQADARCDVYSLGVLLYELLTGERPFRGQGRMVLIQVLEDEPRPPRRLDDGIPRDVETICLKAMAKEASGRYPTAGALAADLRRFLQGEPVLARPVGPTGRLWRRCRRKPVTAAALGALALAVLLGLAGITWQWRRAEAHSQEIERQRLQAKVAFDRAHAAVMAFTRLGRDRTLMSPEGKRMHDTLIRVALDYYGDVMAASRDNPALLAEVATACQGIAEVRELLGSGDGIQAGKQAVATWKVLIRKEPDRRDLRHHLAEAYHTLGVNSRLSRPDESLSALASAGALWESLISAVPDDPGYRRALARNKEALGILYKHTERRDEALRALRHARDLYDGLGREATAAPVDRRALASCLLSIAEILRPAGRIDEAAASLARCRGLVDELLREQSSDLDFLGIRAKTNYLTGALLTDQGRLSQALDAYQEAAKNYAQLITILPQSPEFRRDLGASHHNIGNLLVDLGRLAEAAPAFRTAIAIREGLCRLWPDQPRHRRDLAGTWRRLGETLESLGQRPTAAEAYRRADELEPKTPAAAPQVAVKPGTS